MNKKDKKYLMEVLGSTRLFSMLPITSSRDASQFNAGMYYAYLTVAEKMAGISMYATGIHQQETDEWAMKNCPAVMEQKPCVAGCYNCESISYSPHCKELWGV